VIQIVIDGSVYCGISDVEFDPVYNISIRFLRREEGEGNHRGVGIN